MPLSHTLPSPLRVSDLPSVSVTQVREADQHTNCIRGRVHQPPSAPVIPPEMSLDANPARLHLPRTRARGGCRRNHSHEPPPAVPAHRNPRAHAPNPPDSRPSPLANTPSSAPSRACCHRRARSTTADTANFTAPPARKCRCLQTGRLPAPPQARWTVTRSTTACTRRIARVKDAGIARGGVTPSSRTPPGGVVFSPLLSRAVRHVPHPPPSHPTSAATPTRERLRHPTQGESCHEILARLHFGSAPPICPRLARARARACARPPPKRPAAPDKPLPPSENPPIPRFP